MKLKDKVCIITGAGKGIGSATAKLFYKQGARLALITRTGKDFAFLKRALGYTRNRVFTFEGDASSEADVKEFVKETANRFGRVDVLINNAGMRFRKKFLDITTEEWDQVMTNNLTGCYYFCREAGRHMVKQRKGAIVNIASIVGTLGLPELACYGASKGGMITLTKCLALEWAKSNVRVNAIAPGFCETSYTKKFKKKKALYRFTLERTPQGKWGTAVDIANACLFLSCDDSRYITGETLSVDGGWSVW